MVVAARCCCTLGARPADIWVGIRSRWRLGTRMAEAIESRIESRGDEDRPDRFGPTRRVEIHASVGEAANREVWQERYQFSQRPLQEKERQILGRNGRRGW